MHKLTIMALLAVLVASMLADMASSSRPGYTAGTCVVRVMDNGELAPAVDITPVLITNLAQLVAELDGDDSRLKPATVAALAAG